MGFSERAALRRKSKELKNELGQLKKDMISGGCEKNIAAGMIKELQATLELADQLRAEYELARQHLEHAKMAIVQLLNCMSESPEDEVKESLLALVKELDMVYHECSIRADDADFKSTVTCLRRMVQESGGKVSIMLRSELENTKAVLDDAAGWNAPDFGALAYYFLHEDRNSLKEMENEQRNRLLTDYFEEHFLNNFRKEAEHAGVMERAVVYFS